MKKLKYKIKDYMLLHILLFAFSLCSVFSKLAASKEFLSFEFCLFYGISIIVLGIYALLWQQILKKFTLTTAFLNKAVTIIWGIVWGTLIFGEPVKIQMIIGGLIVFVGVSLVVMADE